MTMPEFQPMRESDLDEVVACEQAAARFPWTRGNFADALTAGNSGWVLRVAGRLVAQAVFLSIPDEANLLILSVHPSARRQGLGRRMLEHVLDRARIAGATQLFLEVRPSNGVARALYDSSGFLEIGRRKAYYPAEDGQREDAIVMRRKL
jgi:ribosomal-protein-alanine acetyltransferase